MTDTLNTTDFPEEVAVDSATCRPAAAASIARDWCLNSLASSSSSSSLSWSPPKPGEGGEMTGKGWQQGGGGSAGRGRARGVDGRMQPCRREEGGRLYSETGC